MSLHHHKAYWGTNGAFASLFSILIILTVGDASAQTIAGRVTGGGVGLASMDIDVFDASGLSVAVTGGRTDASGNFSLTLPAQGAYRLRADAKATDGWADEYWNNQQLLSLAAPIVVGAGGNVGGINIDLSAGVTVSGQVTEAGTPLAGIDIDVYAASGEFMSGYPGLTDAGGSYTVGALPPGSYYIRANPDPAQGQHFTTVYLGGALSEASATPLVVGVSPLVGQNIAVQPGAAIAGSATEQGTGAPLGGLDLDLYDALGNRVGVNASTRADGSFSLPIVPAGNYLLRVDPTLAEGYPRTWYPNANSRTGAMPIVVATGNNATGINFSLVRAGSISGFVRAADDSSPIPGIDLDCFDAAGTRLDLNAVSGPDGTYTIGPMAPGQYRLRADPTATQGFSHRYYNGADDLATATPITVVSSTIAANTDFALPRAGWISGTVVAVGGAPLMGIDLDLYRAVDGVRITLSASTAADGTYLLGPLIAGDYKLRCDPSIAQAHGVEYWDAKPRLTSADPIAVANGTGAIGRNFTLDAGASISGRVTDQATGLGIAGIDIDVLTQSPLMRLDQSAKTAADGTYTIGPFAAGSYYLRADASAATRYGDEYYPSAIDTSLATLIAINPGANVVGIDLQLEEVPVASSGWVLR